jgi:hypothetical protein
MTHPTRSVFRGLALVWRMQNEEGSASQGEESMREVARQTLEDEATPEVLEQLQALVEQADVSSMLSRPEVAHAIRLAAAKVVESNFERYDGLEGVLVGRAYSIAYQELSRYDVQKGPLLGWLSRKVQAGLLADFQ